MLSLYQFDTIYERVVGPVSIHDVADLNRSTFVPRGQTALLDAIGRAINDAGQRFESMRETERPSKVVMVIITDGLENASREFNQSKINDMITRQRDQYQWEFVFLGANQDAIATARVYGISASNAMKYADNPVGTSEAFASVSSNLTSFRSGGARTMGFSQEDRKKQQDAGA